jgi:hypothetical protein
MCLHCQRQNFARWLFAGLLRGELGMPSKKVTGRALAAGAGKVP